MKKQHIMSSIQSEKGQSLIILVLMIALVLTVVAATSYRMTTELESSKIQEESVRALAAADSGIDKGLQLANQGVTGVYSFTDSQIGLTGLDGIDAAQSEVLITNTNPVEFVSPRIQPNEQFTFYLNNYPDYPDSDLSNNLQFFFRSEGADTCNASRTRPAVEITFIYGTNSVRRWLVEPCGSGEQIPGNNKKTPANVNVTIDGVTFTRRQTITAADLSSMPAHKMMIVRPLFGTTHFAVRATGGSLPIQGVQVESRAFSTTGPSKIVRILQTRPQIPAEFFVTSF